MHDFLIFLFLENIAFQNYRKLILANYFILFLYRGYKGYRYFLFIISLICNVCVYIYICVCAYGNLYFYKYVFLISQFIEFEDLKLR